MRMLALACILSPVLAWGQGTSVLDAGIAEIRDQVRYVPEKALVQLQKMESAARSAPPATKAEFLAQLSSARVKLGQKDIALQLAEELIAFGRAQGNTSILAKGLLTKAYTVSAMTDAKSAHELAFEAEKLANQTQDIPLRVQATITSGQSYAEQGNFPVALLKLQTAVETARQLDDLLPLASALNALASLYDRMKEYDKGWAVLEEAVQAAEKLNSPGRIAQARQTEYVLAMDSEQPRRALAALQSALEVARKMGAKGLIADTLVNMSDNYLKERDYQRVVRYASESLAVAREIGDATTEAVALINIGQAYMGMGKTAEGKKNFEAGMAFYEKTNNKPELQAVLLEYGQALERAGDFQGAISAYHRERDITSALFEKQRQKAIWELQEKYEMEKKQRRIELLSRENQVKSAEIDNRRLQQRVWWLLALVFALAATVVGLLYRKVRHANAQLEVKNLELKAQSSLDPLTSLYNRRHFQEYMRAHNCVERRGTGGEDIVGALFLLDVDHFKHINDTYGHAAGDIVLKMIAENLRVALRETDMIVRWGGEEFLAFLPAIPRNGVDEVARRILTTISSQQIEYQNHTFSVNVSVGFAPFPLIPADTPLPWERAVNLVDMALYLAKAHGRNRAYGVRGFDNFKDTSMEAIEQDLERAWRAGFVDLSVVLGGTPDGTPPAGAHGSNVVPLKSAFKAGN
ncbi:diguanylate cyclase [Duganella ginsengisoli]|uniref:diguanylate cyclase n=2 Tax=Pseudoduganella ginsengisoli TaxID=1462440 RepID=A0A6L6PT41_9BURK|nr:diguanylate cyclase [Pseudoduganella ginsengisoli]